MERASQSAFSQIPGQVPPDVLSVLEGFVRGVQETLGSSVEGVVLFGSLAAGTFTPGVSDLDLIVALAEGVDDVGFESLRSMHRRLASALPEWEDRIDAVYIATPALRSDRGAGNPIVVISPGEALHRTRTDPGWILNWHAARESGVSLLGPSPNELIGESSAAERVSAVEFYLRWLHGRSAEFETDELRAYATLAACRALHTSETAGQTSKEAAARWAQRRYPDGSDSIEKALEWRRAMAKPRRAPAMPVELDFFHFAVGEVLGGTSAGGARSKPQSASPVGRPDRRSE